MPAPESSDATVSRTSTPELEALRPTNPAYDDPEADICILSDDSYNEDPDASEVSFEAQTQFKIRKASLDKAPSFITRMLGMSRMKGEKYEGLPAASADVGAAAVACLLQLGQNPEEVPALEDVPNGALLQLLSRISEHSYKGTGIYIRAFESELQLRLPSMDESDLVRQLEYCFEHSNERYEKKVRPHFSKYDVLALYADHKEEADYEATLWSELLYDTITQTRAYLESTETIMSGLVLSCESGSILSEEQVDKLNKVHQRIRSAAQGKLE